MRSVRIPFCLCAVLTTSVPTTQAQEPAGPLNTLFPGLSQYAPAGPEGTVKGRVVGEITFAAQLLDGGSDLPRGLTWRVFNPEPGQDGKLPLVASAQGGVASFHLEPGSYLVHASFGRAGATKRITVGRDSKRENLVLDAGGLKLDAVLPDGAKIPPANLRFSVYEAEADAGGERALIVPDVNPNAVIRLNAGTYHVISTYGSVNAVIRSDIRVEAGKLTEATVEHSAAELTLKLVREAGGEAIADTAWSILTESGDPIRESVGPFASMVLAAGRYTVIAKNRDRIYQRDIAVEAGRNEVVDVLTTSEIEPAQDGVAAD